MKVFVDSDLLIWHLRGDARALDLLRGLRDAEGNELWTGAMQRAEVLFFARPNELQATRRLLDQFRTAPVDGSAVDAAAQLFQRWHASHGIDEYDALLAAAVLKAGGRLVTQNTKHFPMPGLNLQKGWGG
jgi:predicted nucleic acid-binding protein